MWSCAKRVVHTYDALEVCIGNGEDWDPIRGGATVLKVGGTNSASGASRKFFLTPHFLASGGGQNIAYIDKSA